MTHNRTDLSLINDYLNGRLDARAMHELEKRAQHDPMLMDALEGYEASGTNQHANLTDLQQRLDRRVASKKGAVISWPKLSAAASFLLVCGLGIWYWSQPKKQEATAVTSVKVQHSFAPPAAVQPQAIPADTESRQQAGKSSTQSLAASKAYTPHYVHRNNKPSTSDRAYAETSIPADKKLAMPAIVNNDTLKAQEAPAYAYQSKVTVLGDNKSNSIIKQSGTSALNEVVLTSKVNGVQVDAAGGQSDHMIIGRVMDLNNGQPIMGTIRVKDMPARTMTNEEGNFKIAANSKDVLLVSSAGYESKEVKVSTGDSVNVALQPNRKPLSDLIVTNYLLQKKPSAGAEPLMGWRAYETYLLIKSPDGKAGHVTVNMTVGINGSLSDFTIVDGLSDADNQSAIKLIKSGPGWRGNPNGKPEQVKVKVKFY